MNENQTTDIKASLDAQTNLLNKIALQNEQILEVEKRRLRTEQYQIFGKIFHFIFWIVIVWFSFTQFQKITTGLMDKFMSSNNTISQGANLLNGAQGTTNLLNQLLGN